MPLRRRKREKKPPVDYGESLRYQVARRLDLIEERLDIIETRRKRERGGEAWRPT